MALFKSDEERAARAEQKAADAYASSPLGRAEAAHESGDGFFQLELDISHLTGASSVGSSTGRLKHTGGRPDLLGQIEDVGWRLEHAGYVFVETGATTTNRALGSGQGMVTKGVVRGIYLFRRV
ncbi:MAG TPA: hypothetical protein VGL39_27810 [Jatrophihabitantaceae bacterium]|jgi:hypothetical protein